MENIAIIGLGCRFPKAANPEAYWQLVSHGIDAITEIPADRWNADELYDPQPATPGKMNTRWGGFLEQVDSFDPLFFNISPREAERIDPQQRLFLEVAWSALENAGLATDKLAGSLTGVFTGMAVVNYDQLLYKNVADLTQISAYDGIGTTLSLASSRLSYLLDLKGPSLAIETACSSSLVAVHLACQSLRSRESNLCIVGGVNLILTPELNIVFSQARMMSPDGRCKTFDAGANGYVRGEGCGVVILKRLCDAIEAGDNIQAVIRGSAVNQDGASNGITAPNGPSQQAVIRQALNNAGVKPAEISYVEAHGTGTPLGDPIEVKSLKSVLMEDRQTDQPCWIGSVKTNIGHLESAAGIAGLIKVVLALQHQEIPPNLHLKKLNPYIRLNKTPLSIPTAKQSWTVAENRLAGISSFGFGGTNAHVILEQAPVVEPVKAKKERTLQLLTLSARNEPALVELAGKYSEFLNSNPAVSLTDLCFTANVGRTHFEHRLVAIASSSTELQTSLQAFAVGKDSATVTTGCLSTRSRPQIAFLFTGQGSQYVGMGRELYETQPTFRQALDLCADILTSYLDRPLQEIIYSSTSPIDQTKYTQPAIFAIEYALAQLWQSWGIQPSVVMGHSVGEYVAACVAGVFSLADGLKLIAERGRLMQSLPQNGSMVSLLAEPEIVLAAIEPYKEDVAIAAYNGSNSTVISGKTAAIEDVVSKLESQGIKTKYLQVSHGFHSPLMLPMLADFAQVAREITYSSPQIALISNVTGKIATADIATPEYWCNHIIQPVQFARGMETLEAQKPTILLEIGAKPILLGMGRPCLSDTATDYAFLPSLRPQKSDWQQLLESLGEIYLRGIAIDWSGFERDYLPRRRLELPTYPFQRQRYWVKANPTRPISFTDNQQASLLSLLYEGKLERVKNQLETTATLSTAEIELLPKLLNLLAERREQETSASKAIQINNDTTAITIDEITKSVTWEQKIKQLLKTQPKKRKQILKMYLALIIAEIMKIDPLQLDWQQRLSSLGMDSLMATELRRRIETQFGIHLPVEFLAELSLEQFLTQLLCLIEGQGNNPASQVNPLTTTPITLTEQWIIRPQPNPDARCRLFCFPYAGGGRSIFNNWSDRLYPEVEVCLIQLPGRENRLQESPLTRLKLLIQTLTPIIKPYLDLPFTFFGHSLGAWLSFELIRELRRQNSPLPTHLFVSGSKAPQLPDLKPPIHRLPDEKFIAKIKSFNGTPEAVLQDTQLMKRFLPALRADFAILETYFYAEETPLNCPITAFGGWEDSQVNQEELSAWKQQTEAEFTLKMFAGDHFFLHSAHSDLLEAIATQLEQYFLILN